MKQRVKIKPKKAKERACKICQARFKPRTSFEYWCCSEHGYELAKKKLEAKEKKEKKEWNLHYREEKEKLKKLSEYEEDARKVFQKWIRKRDEELPCISCGAVIAPKWDGGHYFKAELYSGLIFHEDNCAKQCSRCNNELHGNEANYRIGLVERIGEERVRWLEENKDRLRVYKYMKEELIEIKKKYQSKLKELL